MLTPRHGKNAQLSIVRLTAKDVFDARVFLIRQTVLFDELRSDGGIGYRHKLGSNSKSIGRLSSFGGLPSFQPGDQALKDKPSVTAAQ